MRERPEVFFRAEVEARPRERVPVRLVDALARERLRVDAVAVVRLRVEDLLEARPRAGW